MYANIHLKFFCAAALSDPPKSRKDSRSYASGWQGLLIILQLMRHCLPRGTGRDAARGAGGTARGDGTFARRHAGQNGEDGRSRGRRNYAVITSRRGWDSSCRKECEKRRKAEGKVRGSDQTAGLVGDTLPNATIQTLLESCAFDMTCRGHSHRSYVACMCAFWLRRHARARASQNPAFATRRSSARMNGRSRPG